MNDNIKESSLELKSLTHSRPRPISYRNQSIDLLRKSMVWFLYDIGLGHERVNTITQLDEHDGLSSFFKQNIYSDVLSCMTILLLYLSENFKALPQFQ